MRAAFSFFIAVTLVTTFVPTASTQQAMENMPGMSSPTATPTSSSTPASHQGHDMSAMPGMSPLSGKKSEMSGMRGMGGTSKRDSMQGMTGMPGTNTPVSTGPKPLARPQPWVPPPGEDRSSELLPGSALKSHMQSLGTEPVEDSVIHSLFLAEILEYRANSAGPDTFRWDIFGWIGGDVNRFWYKTEGSQEVNGTQKGEGDLQLLYGRLISPYWDFQIGARGLRTFDGPNGHTRTYASIGLQGISRYQFDVEPTLFISDRGDVSFRPTVTFDWLLTQKIVLQPRFELEAASANDKAVGVGKGLNSTDLGLRVRYEITREIAPYIGVSWFRRYGETAKFARDEGEPTDVISFVGGVRIWF